MQLTCFRMTHPITRYYSVSVHMFVGPHWEPEGPYRLYVYI